MQQDYTYSNAKGTIKLRIYKDRIIVSELSGYISEDISLASIQKTKELTAEMRQKGKPILLLINDSKITGQASAARTATKQLGELHAAKIAMCGKRPTTTLVAKYIMQFYKVAQKIKVFRNSTSALAWLLAPTRPPHFYANIAIACVPIVITIGVLLGWGMDFRPFVESAPRLLGMNPIVAIILLALSLSLLLYNARASRPPSRGVKIVIVGMAIIAFVVSFLVWLRIAFNIDTHFDRILFAQNLNAETLTSPRTGFNLELIGVMLLLLLTGQTKKWHRYIFYGAAIIIFFDSLPIAIGYAFDFSVGQITGFAPMPLATALCFMAQAYILLSFAKPAPFFTKAVAFAIKYQQPATVLMIGMIFTGLVWQQSRFDLTNAVALKASEEFQKQQNVFTNQSAGYDHLLHGFRSLFEASSNVTADEFTVYFNSSRVAETYPGLNAIAYVKAVPANQKQALQNQLRASASALNPQLANFTIHPNSSQPTLYVIAFAEPNKPNVKQALGFDLSVDPERIAVLATARDTGSPATTGTININAALQGETTTRPGFFITAPIYRDQSSLGEPKTPQQRQQQLAGFINASFVYEDIFASAFKDTHAQNVQFKVFDTATNELLYTYNPNAKTMNAQPTYENNFTIGNRVWKLAMYTADSFGATNLELILPTAVLTAGSALSLLAMFLALSLTQRREAAFALAEAMTEDLHNERNAAVTARNKNDSILASIGDAVFVIDDNERITLFNHATEDISGFSAEEALGQPYQKILQFVQEDSKHHQPNFIRRALSGHTTHMHNHTYLIRKNGTKVAVADSAAPLHNEHNKIIGAIIIFRDVTRETALNRAKDEFVSLASHQLRTPLSAIKWYAEMLLAGDAGKLSQQQHTYVQQMADSNTRMIKLVNSLLDVSRIDLDKFVNKPATIDIEQLVNAHIKEQHAAITKKHIAITSHIATNLPPITADPKLLGTVIRNIVTNAVKYTPARGKIAITARRTTPADHAPGKSHAYKQSLLISIADNGYGIPQAQQSRIFEKLFRADNARMRDAEGNGLGLYLTKQIVERLGGTIWFISTENAGTTFYIIVPFTSRQ